jgi:ankyrin repeat protein
MHKAAARGHEQVARLLIGKGAQVDARGKYGQTPLYMASLYGYKDAAPC